MDRNELETQLAGKRVRGMPPKSVYLMQDVGARKTNHEVYGGSALVILDEKSRKKKKIYSTMFYAHDKYMTIKLRKTFHVEKM